MSHIPFNNHAYRYPIDPSTPSLREDYVLPKNGGGGHGLVALLDSVPSWDTATPVSSHRFSEDSVYAPGVTSNFYLSPSVAVPGPPSLPAGNYPYRTPPSHSPSSSPTPPSAPPSSSLASTTTLTPALGPSVGVTVALTMKRRPDYTADEYLGLARIVVEKKPFNAKHRQKAKVWEEVSGMCKSQGLFLNSSSDVIKNKAIALIKYQENPESATGSKIAREMSSSTEKQTEAEREKAQLKYELDKKGGESIREKLMTTLGKRSWDPDDETTEPESDGEDKENTRRKRRNIKGTSRNSADMKELMVMMARNEERMVNADARQEKAEARQGNFEGKVIELLENSTRVYADTQNRFFALLENKL